jgi:prepilin-type N-terminal cleavage/methylation domain-containing protein
LRRRGLTLFELLLVLAILVLVAAITVPSLASMYSTFRVTSAADAIRAAWARARARAIDDGRQYRFGIVPGTGSYRVAPDGGQFWGGAQSAGGSGGAAEPLVIDDTVPEGVLLTAPEMGSGSGTGGSSAGGGADANGYVPIVVFLPDGRAREDVKMVIGRGRGRSLVLKLRSLTGAVTTEWVNP